MDLTRKMLKEFAEVTNVKPEKTKTPVNVYGYASVDANGNISVLIDGSDVPTPVSNTVAVKDGDRVLVSMGNHTAIITGNFTAPPTEGGGKHIHAIDDVIGLQSTLDGKADDDHNHDDRYYTSVKMDEKLGKKSNSDHTHAKLEGLANIKSIGDNLTLTEEGVLNASGGGGDPGGGAVTGVKGAAETVYRTGNVSLSAENIGAAKETHTHDVSDIKDIQSVVGKCNIDYDEFGSGDIPPMSITQGGTGATTVYDTLVNLGIESIVDDSTIGAESGANANGYTILPNGVKMAWGVFYGAKVGDNIPLPTAISRGQIFFTARYGTSESIRSFFRGTLNGNGFTVSAYDTKTQATSTAENLTAFWFCIGVE